MRINVKRTLLFFLMVGILVQSVHGQGLNTQDPSIKEMLSRISPQEIENDIRSLVKFGTRHTLSDTISTTRGIGAAQRWVKLQLEKYSKASGGRLKVSMDTFILPADGNRVKQDRPVRNIMAFLPGTDTADHEILIISGHIDSRASDVLDANVDAPGANDDGSGTATVMELARVMSFYSFPKTILFVVVTGEEQGLLGAAHLAKMAKENHWEIPAMLDNDIVGNTYGIGNGNRDNIDLRIFSEGIPADAQDSYRKTLRETGYENDGPARSLARYIHELGEKYVDQVNIKMIYRRDRYLRGGDHTAFSKEGFPAVRFTEMNENFNRQHQTVRTEKGVEYGDLPDYCDYPYIAKVASVNGAVLAELAQAPSKPENFRVDTRELGNFTQLSWKPGKYGKPAGYYILIRETSSTLWEKKYFTDQTHIQLNYSKDNYLFGIQAVDSKGHLGIIICPMPDSGK